MIHRATPYFSVVLLLTPAAFKQEVEQAWPCIYWHSVLRDDAHDISACTADEGAAEQNQRDSAYGQPSSKAL